MDQLSDGAERLFWRLTTVADDYGRFEADPRVLLAQCFPLKVGLLKVQAIARLFRELVAGGLVTTYDSGGKCLGFFTTWEKHQRKRAQFSKYPAPSADNICQHPLSTAAESRESRVERRETRDETREVAVATWPHPAAFVALFNSLTPEETPTVETLSPERFKAIEKRLGQFPEQKWWEEVFAQMRASRFVRGLVPPRDGSKKSFLGDVDWLLANHKNKTENCVLVHDGRYLDG